MLYCFDLNASLLAHTYLTYRQVVQARSQKTTTRSIRKMQSFIQYRRIGRDVKAQIRRDTEKGHLAPSTGNRHAHNLQQSHNDSVQGALCAVSVNDPSQRTSLSSDRTQTPDANELVPHLDGVVAQEHTSAKGERSQIFVVGWTCHKDENNPHNWTKAKRAGCTLLVAFIAFVCMTASSIDSAIAPQAAKEFGVSPVVESLATGKRGTRFTVDQISDSLKHNS